jgi:hypothetical protein
MFEDYPTPPPELVQQWASMSPKNDAVQQNWIEIATQAAQWGADQELDACCEWLHWQNLATHSELIPSLRAARRPKPPSLKEQALEIIDDSIEDDPAHISFALEEIKTIRRAIEQLSDAL